MNKNRTPFEGAETLRLTAGCFFVIFPFANVI